MAMFIISLIFFSGLGLLLIGHTNQSLLDRLIGAVMLFFLGALAHAMGILR